MSCKNFGQGFLRLALQAGVPIVPVAVVGAEESLPSLGTLDVFSRAGGPPIPLLATPLPLPTRFHIHWGEPLRFDAAHDDDDEVISELVEQVRSTIRAMIEHGLADREGLFESRTDPDHRSSQPHGADAGSSPPSTASGDGGGREGAGVGFRMTCRRPPWICAAEPSIA